MACGTGAIENLLCTGLSLNANLGARALFVLAVPCTSPVPLSLSLGFRLFASLDGTCSELVQALVDLRRGDAPNQSRRGSAVIQR